MEKNLFGYIVTVITFFFNMFGTHLRNSKWFTYRLRWLISIVFSFIGLLGLFLRSELNYDQRVVCITLLTPLIFTLVDRFFKFISFKYQNRDFQFNTSLESLLNQHKSDISIWDNIITVTSLLIMAGLLVVSFQIAEKINK